MLRDLPRNQDNPHHPLLAWGRRHGFPTVTSLAKELEVSQPRLSAIVNRRHRPSGELALRIHKLAGIESRQLFDLTPAEVKAGVKRGWKRVK